jgi:hypothetical protein
VLKVEFCSGFGEDAVAGVKERERPLWLTNPLSDEQGYNLLLCDGHVVLLKRNEVLNPRRTAHNWNRDSQPHEAAWASRTEWVVQQ